jgi:hypothetical protein
MNDLTVQCAATGTAGPCPQSVIAGTQYCARHQNNHLTESKRLYRLADPRFQQRIDDLTQGNMVYSLKEGIAAVHCMIEDRFNMIKTDADKLAGYPFVAQLLLTAEKLIRSTTEMEIKFDAVLTRDALRAFAQEVVSIITRNLKDVPGYEEICDQIMVEILETVRSVSNSKRPSRQ